MPRQLRAVLALASGFVAAAIIASATRAAPASDAAPRDPTQTDFVDLTAQPNAPAASASDAAPRDPTKTNFVDLTAPPNAPAAPAPSAGVAGPDDASAAVFVDLTKGDSPSATPDRTASPARTPRTRHVDLSEGAAPPPQDAAEDDAEDTEPVPDRITITAEQLDDPYEEANRGRFRTHVALHRYLFDPVERTYFAVVPAPARTVLHNFLTNLETPSALANDVFQGDAPRAGVTLSRFVVNTTLGIGGIFDIAGMAGIPYRDDDFGATLATYGVSDYPYLLVPLIGPSNPRDLTGKFVDFFLNPLRWVALPGGIVASVGHAGLHELDKRSLDVGELDELARTAPDPYAMERKQALARRSAELSGMPNAPQ